MPTLNDFTYPTPVRRETLPHAGGPRTDKGSPPVGTHDDGGYGLTDALGDLDALAADLDALADEAIRTLATTADEYATLAPLHGPAARWDVHRKTLLAAIATELRQDAHREGRKVTEAAIDEAARSDARYRRYVEDADVPAARYYTLAEARSTARVVLDEVRSRRTLLAAEARLMPGGGGA